MDAVYDLKDRASNVPSSDDLNLLIGSRKQSKKVLEMKSLSKSFESTKIIEDYSYIFRRGEKIGIIGKNGTGKSTFLNILTNAISAASPAIKLLRAAAGESLKKVISSPGPITPMFRFVSISLERDGYCQANHFSRGCFRVVIFIRRGRSGAGYRVRG